MSRLVLLVTLNCLALGAVMLAVGVRINISASYPLGVYREVEAPWQRWDVVIACLPDAVAELGIARGYLTTSTQCRGHTPVIKQVLALAGDRVTVDRQLHVNGQPVPNSTLQVVDAQGRALPRPTGGVTEPEHVWLIANRLPGSFDSRYFGAIPSRLVQSTLEPVWTL